MSTPVRYPTKVLCVCVGNTDRSPVMAAVLEMYLRNAGYQDVTVESAGTHKEVTSKQGPAGKYAIPAAKRLGLDISGHRTRYVGAVDLSQYHLVIAADNTVAETLFSDHGVDRSQIHNVMILNPWPCHFAEQYEGTMEQIVVMMYRIMRLYFS